MQLELLYLIITKYGHYIPQFNIPEHVSSMSWID